MSDAKGVHQACVGRAPSGARTQATCRCVPESILALACRMQRVLRSDHRAAYCPSATDRRLQGVGSSSGSTGKV